MKSYFILPIHNKEALLTKVLEGIVNSCHDDFHIVALVDGCVDNSEKVLCDFITGNQLESKFTTITMPDVHEITCLNYGLTKVRLMNPNPDDLVFTVQDDVVLQESNLDDKFRSLFSQEPNLGYISMRLGCDLSYIPDHAMIGEQNLIESEFGHWKPLGWTHYTVVSHGDFVKKQIEIRSPTCVLWKRYQEVGYYDSALAPCGWDCHDFSIRMMQHGYQNGVFAMKYQSELEWEQCGNKDYPKLTPIIKLYTTKIDSILLENTSIYLPRDNGSNILRGNNSIIGLFPRIWFQV